MREFLLANDLGANCNLDLECRPERMYSGYLTASFYSPQDRVLISDNIRECVVAKGNTLSNRRIPNTVSVIECGDGDLSICEQTEFNYKSFQIEDSARFYLENSLCRAYKEISLSSNDNCVHISYDFHCCDDDISITVAPSFTFRKPEVPAEDEAVSFDLVFLNDLLILKPLSDPYPETPHFIYCCIIGQDQIIPVNKAISDILYPVDTATGYKGSGKSRELFEIRLDLNKNQVKHLDIYIGTLKGRPDEANISQIRHLLSSKSVVPDLGNWKLQALDHTSNSPTNVELPLEDLKFRLYRMSSNFLVRRESTGYTTVLAGYPWFLDWGRDTMISFRGLTLSTGRYDQAREILKSFSLYIKNGMLPNVFPSSAKDRPIYNTVDASLWYFYACSSYIEYTGDISFIVNDILPGLNEILSLYTRDKASLPEAADDKFCYGIYTDDNGFVHAGTDASDQLTWMDVRIDGRAVTPRHGTPVEIQALYIYAMRFYLKLTEDQTLIKDEALLRSVLSLKARVKALLPAAEAALRTFYDPEKKCLYDFAFVYKRNLCYNDLVRPNMLWAVWLAGDVFEPDALKAVVNTAANKLYTKRGLRSLAQDEPGYIGLYEGDLRSRDRAYHMGTVWGFLYEPYAEAFLRAYGPGEELKEQLLDMIANISKEVGQGCIDGIAEVFDGDEPDEGKGCYSQAWSVAAAIRVIEMFEGLDSK